MNLTNIGFLPRGATKDLGLLAATLLVALSFAPNAQAGTDAKDMKDIAVPAAVTEDKDWSIELGSGVLFSNVRATENSSYTIVPISLTASLAVDDVSNDKILGGILRGNTEFFFRGDYDDIVHGPETHYAGVIVGPRYNFVQPGWDVIPYVEGGVGVVFADSNPSAFTPQRGLGQDFNFTFIVGAGAKYKISDDFFVRLGVEYQHVSNAGLSEPQFQNKPIDALGPKLSFGYSF